MPKITDEQLKELLEKHDIEICKNCGQRYFKNLENMSKSEIISAKLRFVMELSDLEFGSLDEIHRPSPRFKNSGSTSDM